MRYGFVKVCAATPQMRVADVKYNVENIISCIKKASAEGAHIVAFPELCICGYTCGDLFNQTALLRGVEEGLAEIARATADIKTLAFVGAPLMCGSKLYNCAVAISGGKILGAVPKTYLPTYGEFYERRHFSPGEETLRQVSVCGYNFLLGVKLLFKAKSFENLLVGAEVCEDLWAPLSPSVFATRAGATIIVNLSCSDETVGKAEFRKGLVGVQSAKLICGYVYVDTGDGESTTDMVFAGHNLICENGKTISESVLFKNGLIYGEIDVDMLVSERRRMASSYFGEENCDNYTQVEFEPNLTESEISRSFSPTPFIPSDDKALLERAKLILNMQAKGLEKRLRHTNAKTSVIGVSGGLDSSLALLVVRRAHLAIGKPLGDILAISMPGFGTTSRTKDNSMQLASCLGATVKCIPISDSVSLHFSDIGHDPAVRDVTYENAQARMRTLVLMDIANQSGGLVIGTGDLSELALGWATYNGDHMSMYGVNCSVPKTLVKYLVRAEAEIIGGEAERVLKDILATEISPELLPPDKDGKIAQKTEDLIGPYVLHDFFLYYAIRYGFPPEKVYKLACMSFNGKFSVEEVKKWLKVFYSRFFSQQFKRSCVPDGVKIGSLTLSPRGDWRMPSDAVSALWLEEVKSL